MGFLLYLAENAMEHVELPVCEACPGDEMFQVLHDLCLQVPVTLGI